MRFELGHYGQAVLDRLAQLTTHPEHQQITAQLARLKQTKNKWEWTKPTLLVTPKELLVKLTVSPPNHTLPIDVFSSIQDESSRHLVDGCTTTHPCDIVDGQWDDDPELEYVFLNGCGHIAKGCHNYTVALFNRITASAWKQVASISVAGDKKELPRGETLLAAQEGRLVFSAAQYHCVTVGKLPKVCDYWGYEKE